MAEALLARGAVGTAFNILYDVVVSITKLVIKSQKFKPLLEELTATLDSLKPHIENIDDRNRQLDLPNGSNYPLKTKFEEGTKLIKMMSKVGDFNLFKPRYYDKLVDWHKSICNVSILLIPQVVSNEREIMAFSRCIGSRLERIEQQQVQHCVIEQDQSGGSRATTTAPEAPSSPVGLDRPLKDLKMKLINDNEVSMLTVTAPGGSGKTTLAQMVCHDKDIKDKFSNRILFETVSSKPDLITLRNSRNNFLEQTGDNAALSVLDDVWPESSGNLLQEISKLSERSSYKTLVTSRYSSKYGSNYGLDPLTKDEALTLLRKVSTSLDSSSPALDELMEQIVEYCKKSPLAITVVGKSLFKESIETWMEKVKQWAEGTILKDHTTLLDCLQPSIDVLCENGSKDGAIMKECFVDLAVLPEDGRTPATLLIDMWPQLSENASIVKLQQLNRRNLAKLFVTRELALHQIRNDLVGESKRLIVDVCKNVPPRQLKSKNKLKETHLLSISTDENFSSKWDKMYLPKAAIMLLNFQTQDYALPRKMPCKLKVLIVRNSGPEVAEISNLKVMSSLPTLKRVRLERISISPKSLKKGKSKSLEKISLFMCYIAQPGSNSSTRFFKAMPNLVEINIEYCNNLKELPADLCGLKSLKKLNITKCIKLSSLPEDIGNLINLEVLRLRCCTELETLPDSITSLKNLIYLDISDCFSIRELPEKIGDLCKLEKINMRKCERLKELPESVLDLDKTLKEVICDEEIEELWKPFKIVMENVRITVVKEEINLGWLLGH